MTNNKVQSNRVQKKKKGKTEKYDRTVRSGIVLKWLCDQETARLDHLQILLHWYDTYTSGAMAEHISRMRKLPDRVAFDTAFTLVRKWKREGSVLFERSVTSQPPWVWATSKGIKRYSSIRYVYRKPKEPRPHFYWTNQVRMYIEAIELSKGRNIVWVPDRQLQFEGASFQESFKNGDRYPDGNLIRSDGEIAQQIELHPKSKQRYHEILWRLAARYDTVWYWVNDRTLETVKKNIGRLPKKLQYQFVIYHLSHAVQAIPVQAHVEALRL